MNEQAQPTQAQIVEELNKQLFQALVSKEDAAAQLKAAETQVTAIRNVLAGFSAAVKAAQPTPVPQGFPAEAQ